MFARRKATKIIALLLTGGFFSIALAVEAPSIPVSINISIKDPLTISAQSTDFGQVIPNQDKTSSITIALSPEFLNTQRVKKAAYIIEKTIRPKNASDSSYCNNVSNFPAGQIENNLNHPYFQKCFLPLCSFIEIAKKQSDNGTENAQIINSRPNVPQGSSKTFSDVMLENGLSNVDSKTFIPDDVVKDTGVSAFNYPYTKRGSFEFPAATGILNKNAQDQIDHWSLTLKTPCFQGNCNQNGQPESFDKIPQVLKDKQWGCDIAISLLNVE